MKKRNIFVLIGLVALGGAYFYFRTRKKDKIINIDPKMTLPKKDKIQKLSVSKKSKEQVDNEKEAKKFRQRIPDQLLKTFDTSKEATITRNTNSVTTIKA
jgi:LPXTG-motif cell wall-anchored protein